ncbi:MAG: hypothetical protein PHC61_04195 [Chitinivibrionales bacterium]|nr:hypothetical protein [Chitinivibrionales bacterium]
MKPRRVVMVCAVIAAVIGISFFAYLKTVAHNRSLEDLLTRTLSAVSGGGVSIGRVSVGLLSLHLNNVSIVFPPDGTTFFVRDIRLNFSLTRLVSHRFDLNKSIAGITLVGPRVLVVMGKGAQITVPSGAVRLDMLRTWSIDHINIARGRLAISDGRNDTIDICDNIGGRIWGDAEALYFDGRGSFQEGRNNVALSGALSRIGENNQVRLHITGAHIKKGLCWRGVCLTSGNLEATIECSFPESLTVHTFKAQGGAFLSGASLAISGQKQVLSSVSGGITLSDARCTIDSLSGSFRNNLVQGQGRWDFSGREICSLSVAVQGLKPDSLGERLAPYLTAQKDSAWARLKLVAANSHETPRLIMGAGKLVIMGFPVRTLAGLGHYDSSRLVIDSLTAIGASGTLSTHGFVGINAWPPAGFSLSFSAALDTAPLLPALRGRFSAGGWIERRNGLLRGAATVTGRALKTGRLDLGEMQAVLTLDNGTIAVETPQKGLQVLMLSGRIDSVFTSHPRLRATVTAAASVPVLLPGLAGLPYVNNSDSLRLSGAVSGAWPAIGFDGHCTYAGQTVKGACRLTLGSADKSSCFSWSLASMNLSVSDSAFPLAAKGTISATGLTIDTASIMGGIKCSGRIAFDSTATLGLNATAAGVSLSSLNRWFLKGRAPVSDGALSGAFRFSGTADRPQMHAEIHVRHAKVLGIAGMQTDLSFSGSDTNMQVEPFQILSRGSTIAVFDTLMRREGALHIAGRFGPLPLGELLYPKDTAALPVGGTLTGRLTSAADLNGIAIKARILRPSLARWTLDSCTAAVVLDKKGITLAAVEAIDSLRSKFELTGHVDWPLVTATAGEEDSIKLSILGRGDLLGTLCKGLSVPGGGVSITGSGQGTVQVTAVYTADQWFFPKGFLGVTGGVMQVHPLVPGKIKNVSLSVSVTEAGSVAAELVGAIGKGTYHIVNTHEIKRPYEPFVCGPLDLGIFKISTSPGGLELHLSGFMDKTQTVSVEVAGKKGEKALIIGGPLDRSIISGTLVLRNTEFTYPPMAPPQDVNETARDEGAGATVGDLLSAIRWDLDITAGNPNIKYFWDIGVGAQQRLIHFFQAYADPLSILSVRGTVADKSLRVEGSLRSTRGSVYYGRIFDRNVEVGLDFVPVPLGGAEGGYNNFPILYGSAETFSDTSRLHRIKITALTYDPATGAITQKGRLAVLPFALAQKIKGSGSDLLARLLRRSRAEKPDSVINLDFQLSSDFDENTADIQRQFYAEMGGKFKSIEGAGEVLSDFGEQFIHTVYLQQMEKGLARLLGVDVLGVETSIASNYFNKFYNHQMSETENRWALLENTGVTVGRYFFHDYLLVKAGSSLISVDTALTPEYSLGFEVWPWRYLLMDFDYGVRQGQRSLEYDPRLNLQLQLPIGKVRKKLDF